MQIPFRIIAKRVNERGKVCSSLEDMEFKTLALDDIDSMLYCEKFINYDQDKDVGVRDKLNEITNDKNLYSFNQGIVSTYREYKRRPYNNSIAIHSKIKMKDGQVLYTLETVTDIYATIGRIYMQDRSV